MCFQAHEYRSVPYRISGVACRIITRASRCAVRIGHRDSRRVTAQKKLAMSPASAAQKVMGRTETRPSSADPIPPTFTLRSAHPQTAIQPARLIHGIMIPRRYGRPVSGFLRLLTVTGPAWPLAAVSWEVPTGICVMLSYRFVVRAGGLRPRSLL